MKHNRKFAMMGSAVGIFLLIIDGQTALKGTSEGIELCIKTVIPSLFPFFVLSSVLTSSLLGTSIGFLRPLFARTGIPRGAESLVLTGFLGGYPVGAQSVSGAYRSGTLSKGTAERMLAFCNNAGPSFLFGMIGSVFPSRWMVWVLWGIHIIGALCAALIIPPTEENGVRIDNRNAMNLSGAVTSSIRVMGTVCGWIVLFRVAIAFLNRWFLWLLPTAFQVCVTGLLELANGCCSLTLIDDVNLRFVICSGMLAFGGICVTMQTASVVQGLSLWNYLLGKLIQTAFSLFAAILLCYADTLHDHFYLVILIVPAVLLPKMGKKRCIHAKSIV